MNPEIKLANEVLESGMIDQFGDLCLSTSGEDKTNPSLSIIYLPWMRTDGLHRGFSQIKFQHGPVKERGRNGISEEILIAIVLDRLRSHQAGDYSCDRNQEAIELLDKAMEKLNRRTQDRKDRGVEGTSNP